MSTNMKRKFDQALPESEHRPEHEPKVSGNAERPIKPRLTIDDQVKAEVEKALQVKVLHYLGGGQYGAVYACESLQDGHKYAVKVIKSKYLGPEEKRLARENTAMNEVYALKDLDHENILKYHGHAFLQNHEHQVNCYLAIKTELLDCTLGQILEKRELSVPQVEHLLRSLGGAISFMVERGYAHHDIKPDNIMFKNLDPDAEDFDAAFMKSIPKLTDFGFALHYEEDDEDEEEDEDEEDEEDEDDMPFLYKAKETVYFRGSPFYCSFEKMALRNKKNKGYNPFQADSYSFGVTLLECLMPPKSKDPKTEEEIRKKFFSRNTRVLALNMYRQRHPQEAKSPYLTAIAELIDVEFVSDVINSL